MLAGDLYRIDDPNTGNFFSEALVAKDKKSAYLLVYRRHTVANAETKRVKMQGLCADVRYCVPELNLAASGATLMRVGIPVPFPSGDYTVCEYHFIAQ